MGSEDAGGPARFAELTGPGPSVMSPERFAELVSERQDVMDSDDTLYGTAYYIAPEAILAAGFTAAELRLAAEHVGEMEGWETSGTDQRPGRGEAHSQGRKPSGTVSCRAL